MSNIGNILYLFYRPHEPIYMGKGENNVHFGIPKSYMVRQNLSLDTILKSQTTGEKFPVVALDPLPDLSFIQEMTDDDTFSDFSPKSSTIAGKLITMFMNAKDADEFVSLAAYCRDRINKHMFFYALSVAILHRPDCRGLKLPSNAEIFPSLYMDLSVINRARKEAALADDSKEPVEIPQNYSSTNLEAENKVAYFREDISLNLHHYHWHLVYPFTGPIEIVKKDRRGELFYYMHQQMIARYNFERLSNGLNRVVPVDDFNDPIPDGYFPKLASGTNNRPYPSRSPNMILSNVKRKDAYVNIGKLKIWRNRIFEAIHTGFALQPDGNRIKLGVPEKGDTENGIDMLGNMIESCVLSVNSKYYGSFHNSGHDIIAHIHDPDHRYLETGGVMGNNATAVRDPVFYAWHAHIDDMFYEFKRNIPGYDTDDLDFPSIVVKEVEVLTDNQTLNGNCELSTFWQKSKMDVSGGLDFAQSGSVMVQYTHLQHISFKYIIKINNNFEGNRKGTIRIFLAPKYGEDGTQFTLIEQARLFIELDKFTKTLEPGENIIDRKSSESSVTLNYDMTSVWKNPSNLIANEEEEDCKCGWPQHMLIPKGSAEGLHCSLFVMVSDGDKDHVEYKAKHCKKDASSYCGVINEMYPDRRAMGYPFDRPWIVKDDFILGADNKMPNMFVAPVVIRFSEETNCV